MAYSGIKYPRRGCDRLSLPKILIQIILIFYTVNGKKSLVVNITDLERLDDVVGDVNPDMIFHLAAQSSVLEAIGHQLKPLM